MEKKYYLWVLGCQMNEADAERIDQILSGLNWQKAGTEKEAGLIVVVACSVRQPAIAHVFGKGFEWRKRRAAGKLKTVLTGCVLAEDKEKLAGLFDAILPIGEIGRLKMIAGGCGGRKISAAEPDNLKYLSLPARYSRAYSAYVPISNGCNNYCSYCVVPYTRGREASRDAREIFAECRLLVKSDCKEITLLGQNVNSYKHKEHDHKKQKQINFSRLLKEIDAIEGDFWLRFVSSHPKDLSDELIKAMAGCQRLAPHLHLALQSGSDAILKKMNRHYRAGQYVELAKKIRAAIPGISLSTDIIVGFPGETEAQFLKTAKLMEDLKFDMAYIAVYSPRPGTAAEKMKDDVPLAVKKSRAERLNEILKRTALANNQGQLGQAVRVLVDGFKNNKCYGKTASHKVVSFAGDSTLVGRFVAVKITGVKPFSLSGELV